MFCCISCVLAYFVHLVVLLGVSSMEIKTEDDSNDITEYSHHDKPTIGIFGCSLQSDISCCFNCFTLIHCSSCCFNLRLILLIDFGLYA